MDELTTLEIPLVLQKLLTTDQAWHYNVVPKEETKNAIIFYTDSHSALSTISNELEILLGKNVILEPVHDGLIRNALTRFYRRRIDQKRKTELINEKSEDFLQNLINEAKQLGSSDIHLEIFEDKGRIRFRIDGMLIERYEVNKQEYPSLINKIKIKANLDIAEKRLPQDGRIFFKFNNSKFDIRVSILPTLHGEKIVLRILSNDANAIDINQLGFGENELTIYLESIKKPHGIILISGPTGSGKTTTLYATLKLLNKERTNIVTVEDPIEYTLPGVNQVQLKESIGLTFANALRTFLRQDPDIIMLGEIRDAETAQMAIRAALTGHLVLSTIHTNTAWGTISRLIDMGIPPFLLSSTINCTVAQRLIRLLCPHCKEKMDFNKELYPPTYIPYTIAQSHYIHRGCEKCYYTGYSGRKAIYEIINIDSELAESIKNNDFNISEILIKRKIKSLSQNAHNVFENGETSLEEIYPILMNAH